MKTRIIVKRNESDVDNWKIDFYYVMKNQTLYLFSQNYTDGVYDWFKNGRSENELRQFKGWRFNKALNKVVDKIPAYIKYVKKEIA